MAASGQQLVDKWLAESPVVVFSKTYCPNCRKAKDALTAAGADFTVVELDERGDGDDIQAALEVMTGVGTVPRVFVGGGCIGGGDDTARLAASGELAVLVASATRRRAFPAVSPGPGTLEQARGARWTLPVSDLQRSLEFLRDVCGMRVLQHEELAGPRSAISNGASSGPWSSTLVGYGPPDQGFCLELTHSYGAGAYTAGNGLAHFALGFDDPEAVITMARRLGYAADCDVVTGPDGYRFRLLPQADQEERFLYVGLRVAELPRAVDFYGEVLGMSDLTWDFEHLAFNRGGTELMRTVGYAPDRVPLMLYEDPIAGDKLKLEPWEGRCTLAVPDGAVAAICGQVGGKAGPQAGKAGKGRVLHSPGHSRELPEGAPMVVIADVDGYQIALASLQQPGAAGSALSEDI